MYEFGIYYRVGSESWQKVQDGFETMEAAVSALPVWANLHKDATGWKIEQEPAYPDGYGYGYER